MSIKYLYYKLDDMPCRILKKTEADDIAEVYQAGVGFVPTPKIELDWEGVPISKKQFDAMVLKIVHASTKSD